MKRLVSWQKKINTISQTERKINNEIREIKKVYEVSIQERVKINVPHFEP
jgi:hypothetical protein